MPSVPQPSYPASIWSGDTENIDRRDRDFQASPDARDWERIVSEMIATQTEVDAVKAEADDYAFSVSAILTSNTTLSGGSEIVPVSSANGVVKVTLPLSAGNEGKIKIIKKIDASANVVTVNTSETIDGASTINIAYQWSALQLACTGSGWSRI